MRPCTTIGIFALFLSYSFCFDASAQTTNRLVIDHQILGESNDVTTSGSSATIAHRTYLDEEGANFLTTSLRYSSVTLKDEEGSGPDKSRELKTLVPNFTLMKMLDDKYSLVLAVRPGFYGTFEDIGKDFRVEGGAVVTKMVSDNLTMGLGLGRGTNFGRDLIVPLFQFLWFAGDNIVVRGLLPVRASIWYIPDQDWEFGGVFRLAGSLYNIEDDTNIPDAQQIGFASAQIGGAVRRKLFGNYWAVGELGFTALRRYEWTDEKETVFAPGDTPFLDKDIDNVPYIRIGWIEKF